MRREMADIIKIAFLTDSWLFNKLQHITTLFAGSFAREGIRLSDILTPAYSPKPIQFVWIGELEETAKLNVASEKDRGEIWRIYGSKIAAEKCDILFGRDNDFTMEILFHVFFQTMSFTKYIRISGGFGRPWFADERHGHGFFVANTYVLDVKKEAPVLAKMLTDPLFYQAVINDFRSEEQEKLAGTYPPTEVRLPDFVAKHVDDHWSQRRAACRKESNPNVIDESEILHAINFVTKTRQQDEYVSALDFITLEKKIVRAYFHIEEQTYSETTLKRLKEIFESGEYLRMHSEYETLKKSQAK
jgi:hypothetical protein